MFSGRLDCYSEWLATTEQKMRLSTESIEKVIEKNSGDGASVPPGEIRLAGRQEKDPLKLGFHKKTKCCSLSGAGLFRADGF
jgi:hypothetical protein